LAIAVAAWRQQLGGSAAAAVAAAARRQQQQLGRSGQLGKAVAWQGQQQWRGQKKNIQLKTAAATVMETAYITT
jgi:hypothetical protein